LKRTFLEYCLFPLFRYSSKKLGEHIRGKTIVITGASFGIGEQLALELSHQRVHLVLIARSPDKLQEVRLAAEARGSRVTIITADLYREEETDRVLDQLKALPEGIDVFVNNAGKSIMRPLMESLERYHDVTRTNSLNYLAPVKLLLGLMPILIQKKAQIISVSAINVLLVPAPYWSAYQASKTAFDQWFRCNLAEWKAVGISTGRAYFPLVRTRMIEPNPMYKKVPAMPVEQAAKILAKMCYKKSAVYKPWWAVFAECFSFFGRRLFEYASAVHVKRKTGHT
jgi:short-subunit dehydrogenase